jgi:parallel beta-helix repeat protein
MKVEPRLAVLSLSFILFVSAVNAQNEYFVCPEGSCNYTSIQAAINNASKNDIIWVMEGEYHERINVDKKISLEGFNNSTKIEEANGPIIHGPCNGTAVTLSASGIELEGFIIRDSNIGVLVNSTGCKINYNKLTNNNYGIYLKPYSYRNSIQVNKIEKNVYGIYASNSTSNRVNFNNFTENSYSIYLLLSKTLLSTNGEIHKNNMTADRISSIYLERSNKIDINQNDICNRGYGLIINNSFDNFIYNNNFIYNSDVTDNIYNVFDNGCNFWHKDGKGNYYGTKQAPWEGCNCFAYAIPRNGSKALCNSVYPIFGGTNIDAYPKATQDQETAPNRPKRIKAFPKIKPPKKPPKKPQK